MLFTSESVTYWHPDKICDVISDSILDECLKQDELSRVACECLITTNKLVIAGEITTRAVVDYEQVARKAIVEIGYDSDEKYFNGNTCKIEVLIHTQSPDISQWVDVWWAGDQWMMFWYATNETDNYMPLSKYYSDKLIRKLEEVRESGVIDYILPDWKCQVTVDCERDEDWEISYQEITTVVVSTQHKKWIDQKTLKADIMEKVITPVLWEYLSPDCHIFINPTWSFEIWWPAWDTGLTGRKIIADTYGGWWRHWWWAFSGKDPTKVDRSWALMARLIAKCVIKSQLATRCEVQLAYSIWVAEPVWVYIDCFGTNSIPEDDIVELINDNFDLTPTWIIEYLNLRQPIYKNTAKYWAFSNEMSSWEQPFVLYV